MAAVKNVAIVGAGGNLGTNIVQELVNSGKFHVTGITRPSSTSVMPTGLDVVKTEYDHASLVNALKGQDALVITMAVRAAKDSQAKLIDAAVEAGVKYIMPSEWGSDPVGQADLTKDIFLYDGLMAVRNHLEKAGATFIGLANGFWYEYSLAGTEIRYGFDFDNKTVTMFGDGNIKINTTTWPQVGRAVAAILSDPEKYKNRSVYVKSFYVSQNDMLESVKRVTGETDWTVQYEPQQERYQRGIKMMQEGKMAGFGIAMYARGFYPKGKLLYEVENEALGLPEEDLDEATKVAVRMAKAGFVGTID